jgi:hypothetical protein
MNSALTFSATKSALGRETDPPVFFGGGALGGPSFPSPFSTPNIQGFYAF